MNNKFGQNKLLIKYFENYALLTIFAIMAKNIGFIITMVDLPMLALLCKRLKITIK